MQGRMVNLQMEQLQEKKTSSKKFLSPKVAPKLLTVPIFLDAVLAMKKM